MDTLACSQIAHTPALNSLSNRANDIWRQPAHRIASLIRSGELSALEAVESHIERIEEVNPKLNAVVLKRYDDARAEAREIDRRRLAGEHLPPLAGVPVTIKESLDVTGFPSTFGLPSRSSLKAHADETHVARLRKSGAIVLGKTNLSQLLLYVESDNPVYGRTSNPWNLDRTCGGSSGGEGAIIAAGGSALGLGTDIGGSVRYPAAFCGIASLKPTAGRCPDYGQYSVPLGQREIASQVGLLARTVDDLSIGLHAIDPGPDNANGPTLPIGPLASVDPSRLRVGVYFEDGIMPSSPAVRRAVREAASALEASGVTIVQWMPPSIPEAYYLAFALFTADGGALLKAMIGRDPVHKTLKPLLTFAGLSRRTLSLIAKAMRALGQQTLAGNLAPFGNTRTIDYWRLCEQLLRYRQNFADAMANAPGGPIDCILGPACALPAFHHGATAELGVGGANTGLYNVLGYPAGVVPVARVREGEDIARPASRDIVVKAARNCDIGSAGLPVGVQVAAKPWQEHIALAVMRVIETAACQGEEFPSMSKLPL